MAKNSFTNNFFFHSINPYIDYAAFFRSIITSRFKKKRKRRKIILIILAVIILFRIFLPFIVLK
ncbi:MAG: hypothetical protein A3F72_06935 [Bacteroidetes bacterium RIFCSPLOWO2_12_FULL_35_15]|nr:MAG: hypothetical protein A3F72_06935 [Bacteroidetes bacterium RIFCSPLOWO2_12_FULL_35_15]